MKNEKIRNEVSQLDSETYTELRDDYYRISDGLVGIESFTNVDEKEFPELAKQIALLKELGKQFDAIKLGNVL